MSENLQTTLFLVDDHQFILDGIMRMLEDQPQFEIVGTALDGEAALKILEKLAVLPDLIITDLSMPKMRGSDFVRILKERYPQLKILVLTMHDSPEYVSEIAESGAEGYLLKSSDKHDFILACTRISRGSSYYTQDMLAYLLKGIHKKKLKDESQQLLTQREIEIVKLLLNEKTNQEIADELFISKRTVDTHRTNIMEKTKVKSLVGLFKYALEHDLIAL